MDIIDNLKKDGMLLKKVPKKEQTVEYCKLAIKQNPLALRYASIRCINSKICFSAVKKDVRAFKFVPEKYVTRAMCRVVVETSPKLLSIVPDSFKSKNICLSALKKDVSVTDYIPEDKRYEMFDNNIEIDLIKKVINYNPKWLMYTPDRLDIEKLCINLMEKDFCIAGYMSLQVKMSEAILKYQKSKNKLRFINKYYDCDEKKFIIDAEIVYNQVGKFEYKYYVQKYFEDFFEFYNFLDGDLVDAELWGYDFHGIDLKKYNIEGATIRSNILEAQGLYDGSYFSTIKKFLKTSEYKNEISNECYYPKPIDDDGYNKYDFSRIPFFYISDIHLVHKVCNRFKDKATKEEIRSYIKFLVNELVKSIEIKPANSYLLIAGDTSSIFEFTKIFYNELICLWDPNHIVVVMGNHELLDPYLEMEDSIKLYRDFFNELGIIFLQNDLLCVEEKSFFERKIKIFSETELLKMNKEEIRENVQCSSVIIFGGIGFSGLNNKYNASNICYGKSFDELTRKLALEKDIQETTRFNNLYKKILENLVKNKIIILTHLKKENWNADKHNPNWIYLHGHDHRNYCEISNKKVVYAANQIGYKSNNVGLKYFYCNNDYDMFIYYQDGIYEITKNQYIDFNKGKLVNISFKKNDGQIYMLKKGNMYLFLIYCKYSLNSKSKSLYLMNGGRLIKLRKNKLENLSYYYENLEKYAKNINQLLYRYTGSQQKLSEFIKYLGGSGRVHGCIVDVERPSELFGFSFCHLFINPIDGKVTPYYARNIKYRIVYKDLKTLLLAHDCCKLMADNYLQIEEKAIRNFPIVKYSEKSGEYEDDGAAFDEGGYIYRISRIIKSLQYCTERNIIRIWNEDLLNYDFVNRIIKSNQIDEIVDDRLIIDIE